MNTAAVETTTEDFVHKNSVMREIWGKGDTILFIFAGSAAEFALNKAVDWLYFTGNLPADPLGRLFSTVTYARQIVFAEKNDALRAIDRITAIHAGVEEKRGADIPAWAYRDVLFMLIFYSVSSFELLERKLSAEEKEEVFSVFYSIGMRMGINDLPPDYSQWLKVRNEHLNADLINSLYTVDLFKQYRKHLGFIRYAILIEVQKMIVPERVKMLLKFASIQFMRPALTLYKLSRKLKLDWFLKSIFLPPKYKSEVKNLDQ